MGKNKKIKVIPEIKVLEKAFDGNLDLVLFYLSWLKNGLKVGKAYKELHPNVTRRSADTLGSRLLKKVDIEMVMYDHGLDQSAYFEKLREGLDANRKRAEIVDRIQKDLLYHPWVF